MCGNTWDCPDVVKDRRVCFMLASSNRLFWTAEPSSQDLRQARASGGVTDERSSYGPLANLLNTVGGIL